jgi:hypothetical protein
MIAFAQLWIFHSRLAKHRGNECICAFIIGLGISWCFMPVGGMDRAQAAIKIVALALIIAKLVDFFDRLGFHNYSFADEGERAFWGRWI